jgi:hypothetical protein
MRFFQYFQRYSTFLALMQIDCNFSWMIAYMLFFKLYSQYLFTFKHNNDKIKIKLEPKLTEHSLLFIHQKTDSE